MKQNKVDIARAWRDSDYRNSLSKEIRASLPANPVGEPLSDMESALISGGAESLPSSGWVCTISGECNGGTCCNPFSSKIFADASDSVVSK